MGRSRPRLFGRAPALSAFVFLVLGAKGVASDFLWICEVMEFLLTIAFAFLPPPPPPPPLQF